MAIKTINACEQEECLEIIKKEHKFCQKHCSHSSDFTIIRTKTLDHPNRYEPKSVVRKNSYDLICGDCGVINKITSGRYTNGFYTKYPDGQGDNLYSNDTNLDYFEPKNPIDIFLSKLVNKINVEVKDSGY